MITLLFAGALLLGDGTPKDSAAPYACTIPLTISDSLQHHNTLIMGVDPRATYGFDMALGEMPIPPILPPPLFDVRFMDPLNRKQPIPGNGAYDDIRRYESPAQADTFFVRVQPAEGGLPLLVRWPHGLGGSAKQGELMVKAPAGPANVDMMTADSVYVRGGDTHDIRIIVGQWIMPAGMPAK